MLALVLAFVAGLLTALSPCVLPVLPIVVGSAASSGRLGPLSLVAGLVSGFVVVGLLLGSLGALIGVDDAMVRAASAIALIAAGVVFVSARAEHALGGWLSPLADRASRLAGRAGRGWAGQFVVGVLLGGVWSPCVGPALGAALGLASSAGTFVTAALTMLVFGAGAAVPLLAVAYGSSLLTARRGRLRMAGATGKVVLGVALVAMGAAVLSGVDRTIEAVLLASLPAWWVEVLASF